MGDEGGWTLLTLKAHMDAALQALDTRYTERHRAEQTAIQAALQAQENAVNLALAAAKEAVNKAEVANEKRLEGLNAFRGTLTDQQQTLLPRAEYMPVHKALEDRTANLERIVESLQAERRGARQRSTDIGPYLIAGGTLIVTVFLYLQGHKLP